MYKNILHDAVWSLFLSDFRDRFGRMPFRKRDWCYLARSLKKRKLNSILQDFLQKALSGAESVLQRTVETCQLMKAHQVFVVHRGGKYVLIYLRLI